MLHPVPLDAKLGGAIPSPEKQTKAKKSEEKKLSAIDVAAQVMVASQELMNVKEMIEAMAAKKLWTALPFQTCRFRKQSV